MAKRKRRKKLGKRKLLTGRAKIKAHKAMLKKISKLSDKENSLRKELHRLKMKIGSVPAMAFD